jgi:pyruvate dehydrogenase E1 component
MNSNLDPIEAKEWLDSFDAVNRFNGNNVSSELIQRLTDHAREQGVTLPAAITTPFKNTINPEDERVMPGDLFHGAAYPFIDSLERDGDGDAR